MQRQLDTDADATLLTSLRESSRRLAFDAGDRLRGWHDLRTGAVKPATYQPGSLSEEAFSGIYAISPRAIQKMREQMPAHPFPIMDFLLSFPHGVRIGRRFQAGLRLIDIGKPDTLSEARRLFGK